MASHGELRIHVDWSRMREGLTELNGQIYVFLKGDRRLRYLARINRSRCPRSPRWRRGTRHTDHGTTWSDLFAGRHNDMGGHISIYDGGTNHRVPSGPRRAASRAYAEARRGQ